MGIPIIGPILRWLQAIFFSKQLQIVILGLQSAGKTSLVNVISSGQFAEEMVPTVGFNVSAGSTLPTSPHPRADHHHDSHQSLIHLLGATMTRVHKTDEEGAKGKCTNQDVGHWVSAATLLQECHYTAEKPCRGMRALAAHATSRSVLPLDSGQPRFRSMWERYCRGVSAIVFVLDSAIPRPPPQQQEQHKSSADTESKLPQTQYSQQSAPSSKAASAIDPTTSTDKSARVAGLSSAAGAGSASSRLANIAWYTAADELHSLLSRPELAGIPLLVLATKNDVKGAATVEEVIRVMRLDTLHNREVSCYSM